MTHRLSPSASHYSDEVFATHRHPAVTVIIPATSDPEHLVDNMGAGVGRLPDERTRTRMEELFDGLT